MKIVSLYPSNDVYQVVSEDEQTVYFQGSKEDCEKFIDEIVLNQQFEMLIKRKPTL